MKIRLKYFNFKIKKNTKKYPQTGAKFSFAKLGVDLFFNNDHILNCLKLNESEKFDWNLIYNGNIYEKLEVLNIFIRNINRRKKYLPQDSQ